MRTDTAHTLFAAQVVNVLSTGAANLEFTVLWKGFIDYDILYYVYMHSQNGQLSILLPRGRGAQQGGCGRKKTPSSDADATQE